MINKDILKILRCPETKQQLDYIEGPIIDAINAEIKKGILKNRGDHPLPHRGRLVARRP